MTQREFDEQINRLLRRVELLRAARSGEVKLRRVKVTGHWVSRHWVGDHDRYIAPRRPT